MVGYRSQAEGRVEDERRPPEPAVALLEAQAEAAGIAVLAVGDDGAVLFCSRSFVEMWGLPAEAISSPSLATLLETLGSGDDTAASIASLLVADLTARRGEIVSTDERVIEWGLAETSESARVWTFREVSRERNARRSLRDAENWLRMFAAHTEGVFLELDANVRIVGTWTMSGTFFDRPESALQGSTLRNALAEPHGPQLDARVHAVLATGRPDNFEYVVGSGEQRRVYVANMVLVPFHDGYPTTVTVLIRDVTSHARLQHQLLQSERLASLGVLAAGVAHEINNPLAYMLLNLERLRRVLRDLPAIGSHVEGDDVGLSLDMAIEGTVHVQRIVSDLRLFSRSRQDDPLLEIDVFQVLAFTLDLTGPVIRERARITRDFGEVPMVLASDGRLNQVLLNLVLNAAQAIPEGAPEDHEVGVRTFTDPDGNAVIEVRDTGLGIPEAHLRQIFDPFFTTKPPGVGTGLGLAICHSIVTSFGGRITVDSTVGVGSVFRVVLPPLRR